jgi:hypothetical protein
MFFYQDFAFHVYCGALDVVVSSALCQPIGENQRNHPIAFVNKQLIIVKRN